MPIYTKTGDKGETSLFSGQRVPKDDSFMHALGTLDECSSAIGLALSLLPKEDRLGDTRERLVSIQHALFDLGAAVATPRNRSSEKQINKTRFGHDGIEKLENWIDEMDATLPKLTTFILPGGHPSSAALHLARNMCRRAERHAIPLHHHAAVSDNVIIYLNRLSDYLFVLTRLVNHLTDSPETVWEHKG
jgi:cob(I)alamin adenosyltransferase